MATLKHLSIPSMALLQVGTELREQIPYSVKDQIYLYPASGSLVS